MCLLFFSTTCVVATATFYGLGSSLLTNATMI